MVRGLYDVAGLRADADFMIWTHAERVEDLQATYADFRRTTTLGRACSPVWSSVALHRPAEFNKSHVPAFLAGEEPGAYICVYPFVRSYEWYLLPDEERRRMLAEHGMAAREYKDVRANTVPAFALGDYEWILAFEAPELDRIVDLMRELRATDARRHTREETPFFTGPRVAGRAARERTAITRDANQQRKTRGGAHDSGIRPDRSHPLRGDVPRRPAVARPARGHAVGHRRPAAGGPAAGSAGRDQG